MKGQGVLFAEVIKRDGTKQAFDSQKIADALTRAGLATTEFSEIEARRLTIRVLDILHSLYEETAPSVEQIQDVVEEVLLHSPYKKTAKAYILYRDQHSRIREISAQFNAEIVTRYLSQADWKVNENSNMGYSLQGLNNYIASEISKTYWLREIYPESIRMAHQAGDIHIHDLGSLSVYCVGWDLLDLLQQGFKGAEGKIQSSPPSHLSSALGQIVNFFYTLQGEAAGAQAFSNFDTLLAPFIYYDKLNYAAVKQHLQEFVFNLNVPTRVGFQTPFTNLTFDLVPPGYLSDTPVIIGGSAQDKVYGDFQAEMDMLNRAFLEVMCEGDARDRIFSFPIPTYNITEEFDWDNPVIDVLWEATAKYGFAYFANFIHTDMKPEDARSMCCRLRIDNRELRSRGGSLFGANPLTGSIGVVTINLPRLGYISQDEEEFFHRLSQLMDLARDSLEIKRKVLEKFSDQQLYPYSSYYLRHVKQRFGTYWQNHFSTIGLVGMNEACLNLMRVDISHPSALAFAERTLDFMRDRLRLYQEQTGYLYNLEATPAESTAYRLARLDMARYPRIICANEASLSRSHEPFYTNSTQLPVDYSDDPFTVLAHQQHLVSRYTGGSVIHLFVGERINDPSMVRRLIKLVCQRFNVPYFTITPTFSICPQCGYVPGEHTHCPQCHVECEIYSRIVGYFRTVKQWNKGKKEEFKLRKTMAPSLLEEYNPSH